MADINIDGINDVPPPRVDSVSNRENRVWNSYEEELFEQHQRFKLRLNRNLFVVACIAIWVVCLFLIVLFMVWGFHILTPKCNHYLSHSELQTIERIIQ